MISGAGSKRPGTRIRHERRRRLRRSTERGSASIEVLVAGAVLLIPTVYLAIALASIQGAQAAARSATIGAARSWARDGDAARAQAWARESLAQRAGETRISELVLDCEPRDCTWPDGIASAHLRLEVPIPLLPSIAGGLALVTVRADIAYPVARFGREQP